MIEHKAEKISITISLIGIIIGIVLVVGDYAHIGGPIMVIDIILIILCIIWMND